METAIPAPSASKPRTGRLVAGSLVSVLALLLIAVGITGIWYRASSDHGYVASGTHTFQASGRAIVTDAMDVGVVPDWLVAKLRVRASSDKPLFVGVGRRADVDRYLAGAGYSTLEDVNFGPFTTDYSARTGSATPARPATQSFWAASSVGTGERAVTWKVRHGSWRVVVMNADGSAGVATDANVGFSVNGALVLAIVALGLGLALAGGAVALIGSATRRK